MPGGDAVGAFRTLGRALAAFALGLAPWAVLAEEPRFAVVIGNETYEQQPLVNPVNDARTVAAALSELGFEVIRLENATLSEMRKLPEQIRQHPDPGSVAVFYYAGHALQHRGHNYLLPVDFELTSTDELPKNSLRLDPLLEAMHATSARLSLLVLDACRDNPFGRPDEALGPGLAPLENAPGETLVAYATAAGAVAQDGTGPNSPFTAALVSALEKPGLDIYDVFREVRARVREATEGRQLPWISGSIESDFVLRQPVPSVPTAEGEISLSSVYWNTIRTSVDPRDFERYLQLDSSSRYATLARERRTQAVAAGIAVPEPVVKVARENAPPGGLLAARTPCDLVVSSPADPMRVAEGVQAGLVNTRLAIRLCADAVAADPGNPRLLFLLGRALDIADRRDEARSFYEKAAAQDYSAALANLGYMYREGRGVAPDHARAMELYRRAALRGNLAARNSIGRMYRFGMGVPQAPEEGFLWTRLAAEDGWAPAMDSLADLYRLGLGTPKNPELSFAYYLRAAQLGVSSAMQNVGRMLRTGFGVEQNLDQAVVWLERANAAGNMFAARELGRMYRKGWHLERDPERAIELFELSAERGFVESYADIAEMHEQGDGVKQDPAEALYFYRLTIASGLAREQGFRFEPAEQGIARLEPVVPAERQAVIEEEVQDTLRLLGPIPPRNAI